MAGGPLLLGCDFSSAPRPQKTIVVASGAWVHDSHVALSGIEHFSSLAAWHSALTSWPAWVGGFDLPFGLPRELVSHMGWPTDWRGCVRAFAAQERAVLREHFRAFCDARPVGHKWAHRATDGPAGSSPSMKWVQPPVAWMMHAGVPVLLACDAHFPAHEPPPPLPLPPRVALEAYPGLIAREVLGLPRHVRALGYKNDAPPRQTPEQRRTRARMVQSMVDGVGAWGVRLAATPAQQALMVDDAQGDVLDAVLCLMQAAWAWQQQAQGHPRWGLPAGTDPLEGWIVGA